MVFHAYCGEERSCEPARHGSPGRREDRQVPAQLQLPRLAAWWGGRQTSALPSSRIGAMVLSLPEQEGKGSEKGLLGTPPARDGYSAQSWEGYTLVLARLFPKGLHFIEKT